MNTKEITQLMNKTKSLIDELTEFYDKLKLEGSSNEDETFSDKSSDSDSSDEDSDSDNETKESNKRIISKQQPKRTTEKNTVVKDNKSCRKVSGITKELLGLDSNMINYEDLRKAVDSYIVANQLEEDGEITLDKNLRTLFNSKENSIKKKGPGLANNIRKNLFVDE
jgi:hypothetical protein